MEERPGRKMKERQPQRLPKLGVPKQQVMAQTAPIINIRPVSMPCTHTKGR